MKLFRTNKEAEPEKRPAQESAPATEADIAGLQKAAKQPEEEPRELTEADFRLFYEPEGVFLTLDCERPLSMAEQERLIRHFSRKKLKRLNTDNVFPAFGEVKVEHVLIAPPQEEVVYDESYHVSLAGDMMEAAITLSLPDPAGGKRLEEGQVADELARKHQIAFGLDREALHALFEAPVYEKPQVIARGLRPVPGEDGRLEWHIERRDASEVYRVHEVAEDERMDYKNLDLFEHVTQDQLLVTRVPPQKGTPGRTVLGREAPAPDGKNYLLPQGKNTYVSKDGLELRAAMPGRADEVNGRLVVSNVYNVPGDVDLSVGNIDFDGDVGVGGNVINGFVIKATGNIEVNGIVEGSALEAGGDIVIRSGIQGGGKGMLKAQGGIYVRFAEYATLQAGGVVSAESLLHSNVSCLGPVDVTQGRGSIIGGNICAGTYIAARFLGNPSGRATDLQVGLSPQNRVRLAELEKMTFSLQKVVDRLQEMLQEEPGAPAKSQREQEARMENVRKLLQYKKLLLDHEEELQGLKESLEGKKNGEVHALHTAYPGVNIAIGLAKTRLSQPVDYATYRRTDGGEIEFTNCRFRPQPIRQRPRRR